MIKLVETFCGKYVLTDWKNWLSIRLTLWEWICSTNINCDKDSIGTFKGTGKFQELRTGL